MYRNACLHVQYVPTHIYVFLGNWRFCVGMRWKTSGMYSLDLPAISNSHWLLSLDIPELTCVTTQSDYQVSNPPLRLTGWVRGLQMISDTTYNPAPSISTVRGRGQKLLLLLSPLLGVGGAMQPWITVVASAAIWRGSCQQDVLNQSTMQVRIPLQPLSCPWSKGS